MAIDYASKYSGAVDERFKEVSKSQLCTNDDFDFGYGKSIVLYDISTAEMHDYSRSKKDGSSRYGTLENLNATKEELILSKDRSFTFVIDKMDKDETVRALESAKALDRQIREVVSPEIDKYRYEKMCSSAGTVQDGIEITEDNIYDLITSGTEALDESEVPQDDRFLLVTPSTYRVMKKSKDIAMETDIGHDMRIKGIVAEYDGMSVLKVPSNRVPTDCGFLIGHPMATASPVKLAEYKIHEDPPGISGDLIEGRVYYDAFVPKNKKKALYYQKKISD